MHGISLWLLESKLCFVESFWTKGFEFPFSNLFRLPTPSRFVLTLQKGPPFEAVKTPEKPTQPSPAAPKVAVVRLLLPTELRRRLLWRSKCFECQCERCVAEVRVRMRIWANDKHTVNQQIVEVLSQCKREFSHHLGKSVHLRKIRCEEWVALSVLKLWNNTRRFKSQGNNGCSWCFFFHRLCWKCRNFVRFVVLFFFLV